MPSGVYVGNNKPKIDLVGRRFSMLEVLRYVGNKNSKDSFYWECRCDCGNHVDVAGRLLREGSKTHCGCNKKPAKSKGPLYDLTGKQFSLLSVIRCVGQKDKGGVYYWLCLCKCNKKTTVNTANLRYGHVRSCGCLKGRGGAIPGNTVFENKRFAQYIAGSNSRNLQFKLTREYAISLFYKKCYYCGSLPSGSVNYKNRIDKSDLQPLNGIDRIENDEGYTIENCVPCCYLCNRMKSRYSHDTFIKHIIKMSKHIRSSNIQSRDEK